MDGNRSFTSVCWALFLLNFGQGSFVSLSIICLVSCLADMLYQVCGQMSFPSEWFGYQRFSKLSVAAIKSLLPLHWS
jgi:hypothetical protein